MKKTALAVVVLVVIGVAAAFAWRWRMIADLREPILAEMNDPDAAQFRNERIISPWDSSDAMYCGEVNGKNRMGGYVGYEGFVVVSPNERHKAPVVMTDIDGAAGRVCASYLADAAWWWIRW